MKISVHVSMCGEASLKQSVNVRLGLSSSGRQTGSVIGSLEGHGREGNFWSHQEVMRHISKFPSRVKNHQTCWCPRFGVAF